MEEKTIVYLTKDKDGTERMFNSYKKPYLNECGNWVQHGWSAWYANECKNLKLPKGTIKKLLGINRLNFKDMPYEYAG